MNDDDEKKLAAWLHLHSIKARMLLGDQYDELTKEPRRVITAVMKKVGTCNPLEVLGDVLAKAKEQFAKRVEKHPEEFQNKLHVVLSEELAIATITSAAIDMLKEWEHRWRKQ